MPRNRMVKADFWVSEKLLSCSRDARLLFIGLWCFCDDNGIHPASFVRLKMEVFPGDNCSAEDIRKWFNELLDCGVVREYVVEEKDYWIVSGWKEHQTINRPSYRYPPPQTDLKLIINSVNTHGEANEQSVIDHEGLKLKEKAKEKEKEKDKKIYSTASKAGSPQGRKTSFPEGMTVLDSHRALAKELGLDVDNDFLKFKEWHLSKGSKFVRWDMAFNKWLRNAAEFAQGKTRPATRNIMEGVGCE